MALYVYKSADGSLYSWAPTDSDPVADDATLAANGMAKVSGLPAIDSSHSWDATQKSIVNVTPPTPAIYVEPHDFIDYFTAAEVVAIYASTDPQVIKFTKRLGVASQVNLADATVQGGLAYLTAIGLLASGRAAQITAKQVQTT